MSETDKGSALPKSMDVDRICDAFEIAWREFASAHPSVASAPCLEDYLRNIAGDKRSELLRELLSVELCYRSKCGKPVSQGEYLERFPDEHDTVREVCTRLNDTDPTVRNHPTPLPDRIGRFTIRELINQGSFAVVYRAYDETLNRDVALKVPHANRISGGDAESYLAEARILAGLRHPNIVQLHDVTECDGAVVLVSEFIQGTNLADHISRQRMNHRSACELIAAIADALHHAHTRGLVHRDVKPANILLDQQKPFLADFGLALTEDDYGRMGRQGGTVAYMSPEQARGEGHLVDGRSDVFSLGTVLYELLTGTRPFRGSDWREVLDRVIHVDPKPPRMIDDLATASSP